MSEMSQNDLAARTQSMTARTQSFSYEPSVAALAARSWHAVQRLQDAGQRREAMDAHFDRFPPAIARR